MKYQVGEPGRIIVVRFSDGDDVIAGLTNIAKREDINCAAFNLVGGLKAGRFVVGPELEKMPPVPVWRELEESHEVVGFGTIFRQYGEPKVHFHGTYGKWDNVKAGCLRESTRAFLVMEAVITEIKGVHAVRRRDPQSGMALMELEDE